MNPASTLQPGLPSTDYYAPEFIVEIEGREIDPESKGDVLEVKVTMDLENLTSCELTINNWNDRSFNFKYSNGQTFDVGNRVHVSMGYVDALRSMLRGQISSLSPRFPESGPPTLNVTVLDGMFKLRDRQPKKDDVKRFEKKADWQIAQVIAQRNGLRAEVTQEGETHDQVVQKNQDDAQFLMERAKRIDFDCFVQTDPGTGDDVLFFVKPKDGRDSRPVRIYRLVWGESLINFSPTLTLSRQVESVTVRGWNPRTKSVITYTATQNDLPGSPGRGTSGPAAVAKSLPGKQQTVIDAPVTSEQEARDLAISLLSERAYEFITGSGKVIGLPDLRPGDNLELLGLGKRFEGFYYVKKVEHTLGSSGYTTQFEVRKVYDGGLDT
jgi:Bacteriophage probable baseplate hub protein